jgi:hypothetical protein
MLPLAAGRRYLIKSAARRGARLPGTTLDVDMTGLTGQSILNNRIMIVDSRKKI